MNGFFDLDKNFLKSSLVLRNIGDVIIRVDKRYFRPTEVESLLGDPSKAKKILGWKPKVSVQQMCAEMVASDFEIALKESLLQKNFYSDLKAKK